MQIFVETHYYDGGFKSLLFPLVRRPHILPAADRVGLKSSEAELAEGDYAFEMATFRQGSHVVCWLGCYTRGTDFQYGDRGTYTGVGIWLVDAVLIHGAHMIGFLQDAALTLAKGGMRSPETLVKLHRFVKDFHDLRWCVPRKPSAPPPTEAGAGSHQTSYLLFADHQPASLDLVGIDIISQLRATAPGPARRVYFLAPRSRVFVRQTEKLAFRTALSYAEHLIHTADMAAAGMPDRRDNAGRHQIEPMAI